MPAVDYFSTSYRLSRSREALAQALADLEDAQEGADPSTDLELSEIRRELGGIALRMQSLSARAAR